MVSINFGAFFGGNNWFQKSPNPLPAPINLLHPFNDLNPSEPSNRLSFASLSSSNFLKKPKKTSDDDGAEKPGRYKQMLDQFFWECENRPDYRHTPEVERILNEDPIFEKKENPTPEEIEENKKWWEEFRSSPVVKFLARTVEIEDAINKIELEENSEPYRSEDKKYWQEVPHVIGLDGRPIPRKAIKTDEESDNKFWDFARQFFFGLWGFRQRPYPPCKPIDVAQAIGYKRLEKRYYDCKSNNLKLFQCFDHVIEFPYHALFTC